MKSITVSVPEDIYRDARICAARRGTSVSVLVARFLRALSEQTAEFSRLEAQQKEVQNQIRRFRASDRLKRDQVHNRAVR
jgi:hypothetical protein